MVSEKVHDSINLQGYSLLTKLAMSASIAARSHGVLHSENSSCVVLLAKTHLKLEACILFPGCHVLKLCLSLGET
jgi:hypothetical protein